MTTAALRPTETERPAYDGWMPRLRGWFAVLPLIGLCTGLAAQASGHPEAAAWAWTLATLVVLVLLASQVVTSLAHGDIGLDLVALLAMGGALALSQPLAGAVIALMYAGGQSLEAYAAGRAGRAMTALIARQPRTALREEDGRGRRCPSGPCFQETASWSASAMSCRWMAGSPPVAPFSTGRASPARRYRSPSG